MKNILFLTDFSDTANKAVDVAVQLTQKFGATLHVMHSLNTAQQYINMSMASTGDLGMPGVEPDIIMETLKTQREQADTNMSELVDQLKAVGVSPITVMSQDDVMHDAAEYAEDQNIDLVLMGTHGAKGFREAFIGSNAQKMVRECATPVLTLSDRMEQFNTTKMVYASDFTEEAINKKVGEAKAFADALGAELHLVFINTPAYFEDSEKSHKRLDEVAKTYGIAADHTEVYNDYTIEDGILAYAKKIDAGIVSLTTHGFKGFRKLLNDNITETVVNHSKIPVLSYTVEEV